MGMVEESFQSEQICPGPECGGPSRVKLRLKSGVTNFFESFRGEDEGTPPYSNPF